MDEVPALCVAQRPGIENVACSIFERDETKRAITDQKVTLGAVTRIETDGTSAYVVVPSVYSFKQQGVAMRESAQMTFVLKKGAAGWPIYGWTWTGPKAQKAPAASAK